MTFLLPNTPAFEGITNLATADSDLTVAAPHVTTFLRWQSSVLQQKVDTMKKAKGLIATEQGLLKDLDELNTALGDLAASWQAITDKKKPPPDATATVREDAEAVRAAMATAYVHLEGEIDRFPRQGGGEGRLRRHEPGGEAAQAGKVEVADRAHWTSTVRSSTVWSVKRWRKPRTDGHRRSWWRGRARS